MPHLHRVRELAPQPTVPGVEPGYDYGRYLPDAVRSIVACVGATSVRVA